MRQGGYKWWTAALNGEKPEIFENYPENGFFKIRRHRDGPWIPVAIYDRKSDGIQTAVVGSEGNRVSPEDVWVSCAKNPVTKEACMFALKHGNRWEDDAPTIIDNLMGHNAPNEIGLLEQLADYMETTQSWLKDVGEIDTQQKVNLAANYSAELTRLSNAADKERKGKIEPHLEAQRNINGEYNPKISLAKDLIRDVKRSCDKFLIAEQRRLEEEARQKYESELAEAKKKEAERKELMEKDPIAALTEPEEDIQLPLPPTQVKARAGGQRGKRMSLRKVKVYEIEDYEKALAWCAHSEEIVRAVEKVCFAAARDGEDVPGVVVKTEERAA